MSSSNHKTRARAQSTTSEAGASHAAEHTPITTDGDLAQAPATQTVHGSLKGWHVTGPGDHLSGWKLADYVGEIDPDVIFQGKPCAVLHATQAKPQTHGVIMQSIDSVAYLGKRVRFAAWIRGDEEDTHSSLWARVVPSDRDAYSFVKGSIRATTSWQFAELVFPVDPRSSSIMFGLSLRGNGRAWMSDATFETVADDVPLTQALTYHGWEPRAPINLDLSA